MTTYTGSRSDSCTDIVVKRNGIAMDPAPSQKLWNHSPDGFNWGYGGSGPAQLALALLFDVTKDKDLAVKYHQLFKRDYVAAFEDEWSLSSDEIQNWLKNVP